MINLRHVNVDVNKARREHVEYFKCYITKRLTGKQCVTKCNKKCKPFKKRANSFMSPNFEDLKEFVIDQGRLHNIIGGRPSQLKKMHNEFIDFIDGLFGTGSYNTYIKTPKNQKSASKDIHRLFLDLYTVFNYDHLTNGDSKAVYSAYKLTENLNIRACTYCNRAYTVTRAIKKSDKLMRPQLDHWFPKSLHPLLAVSFYNLIPSCYHCNSSVKGDITLDLKQHIHPYVSERRDDDIAFDYYHHKGLNEYRIFLKKTFNASGKALVTLRKLKIDEMYNAHHEELKDLIKIRSAYSSSYIDKIKKMFPKSNMTDKEIYRLLFGTELDSKDFHKRPFSKFKYDILKELGIVD